MSKNEALYDPEEHGESPHARASDQTPAEKRSVKLGEQRLADLRSAGGGPPFIKPTRREVRYPVAMLDKWAAARNRKPILDFVPLEPTRPPTADGPEDTRQGGAGGAVPPA